MTLSGDDRASLTIVASVLACEGVAELWTVGVDVTDEALSSALAAVGVAALSVEWCLSGKWGRVSRRARRALKEERQRLLFARRVLFVRMLQTLGDVGTRAASDQALAKAEHFLETGEAP